MSKRDEILEQNKDKRTKCMVYTRCMGYHRPVESFNIGKKGEHKERVQFREYGKQRTENGKRKTESAVE